MKEAVWLGGEGAELVIRLPRVQALHPTMHWICYCLPQVHLLYCALYNVYNLSASCQLGFFKFILALKSTLGEWSINSTYKHTCKEWAGKDTTGMEISKGNIPDY